MASLKKFEEFMAVRHHEYNLLSKTDTTISYIKTIAEKKPNLGTAGCLFFLGIVPAIIYWLLVSKPAKTIKIEGVILESGQLLIQGDEKYRIQKEFVNYLDQ